MPTTNLNIRCDKIIKENADKIYSELGMSMTTAVNLFLRASIRANGIPFDLKLSDERELTEAKFLLSVFTTKYFIYLTFESAPFLLSSPLVFLYIFYFSL